VYSLIRNEKVGGSIPLSGTTSKPLIRKSQGFFHVVMNGPAGTSSSHDAASCKRLGANSSRTTWGLLARFFRLPDRFSSAFSVVDAASVAQ